MDARSWPELPYADWQDTCETLHMWTQIVGKIRLALTPLVNHYWNVPLYVTARGLTTSAIPYQERTFEIEFDFISHTLVIRCSDGATRTKQLAPQSVADFYADVMKLLGELGIEVKIWTTPVEIENPIPFEKDFAHASYDAEYANRFWRVLVQADRVFKEFRAAFIGKVSPVHFFWGSFDLAVTRFNGERAPEREGADAVTREAYSHAVISHGFWPGGAGADAAFYSYTTPEPDGLSFEHVRPAQAFYSSEKKEFFLPYTAVQQSNAPEQALMEFLHSTYDAGANLAHWERDALERR